VRVFGANFSVRLSRASVMGLTIVAVTCCVNVFYVMTMMMRINRGEQFV